MKFNANNVSSISIDGKEYTAAEDGTIDLPDGVNIEDMKSHGMEVFVEQVTTKVETKVEAKARKQAEAEAQIAAQEAAAKAKAEAEAEAEAAAKALEEANKVK